MRKHVLPVVTGLLPGLSIGLIAVDNRKFGRMVGVSGLLTGADVERTVRKKGDIRGPLVLPPNSVGSGGRMIDDTNPADLGRRLGNRIIVPDEDFLESRVLRASRRL
jgi:hypothetical protein